MKRLLTFFMLLLPIALSAQTKLSANIAEDFSNRVAERYQQKNHQAELFIADQLSKSGTGGLDIDKTMTDLKSDPAALDESLKFLYQYNDCNRQTLIAYFREMGVLSGSVFPLATYTVNKYKTEAKTLIEEKATIIKMGAMPVAAATPQPIPAKKPAPAKKQTEEEATTTTYDNTPTMASTGDSTAAATTTTAAAGGDDYNWDVRTLFKLRTPQELEALYGKDNVVYRGTTDLAGNDAGNAYFVFPDTDNEMQVIFDGDKSPTITFTRPHSKWKSPFGIKVGDPLDKVVKVNGRDFKINGFEWTDGGIVNSWEGGSIAGKGVLVLFKANNSGDPSMYDKVTGDKKVKTDMGVLKKLEVVVDKIEFKSN
ncbi:hypothetical protein [Chitinophaga sp.]|uniref:hypothetical protein n=1 Tax=Chitinophaga sp. TaxID=1869181 RepID=UPI0031D42757